MVPSHIKESIDAWVLEAKTPGTFVKNLLENNLHKAILAADNYSLENIKDIIFYLVNEVPAPAWGDKDKLVKWSEIGGQRGIHQANLRKQSLILGDDDG